MLFIVDANVIARRRPKCRPTEMTHACAKRKASNHVWSRQMVKRSNWIQTSKKKRQLCALGTAQPAPACLPYNLIFLMPTAS